MNSVPVPWWVKFTAKIMLSRVPAGKSLARKAGFFKPGQMDDFEYSYGVFQRHLAAWGRTSLEGLSILELGPGDGITTAILAYAFGARSTVLVDAFPNAKLDIAIYQAICRRITEKTGKDLSALCKANDTEELLKLVNGVYLTHGLESLKTIDSHSVDFVFSQAVLEHILKSELRDTLTEIKRILRPDGVCSHVIDFRDHLGGGLNSLRFSSKFWESKLIHSSGFYTNRICYPDMIEEFEWAGFKVISKHEVAWDQLPTKFSLFAREYKNRPQEDYLVYDAHIVLELG